MQDYSDKPDAYFRGPREDIAPLLPPFAERVLEVGCGSGSTLAWLKRTRRCRIAVGLELFEAAAAQARDHADEVIGGNAEALIESAFEHGSIDLMLCLDVLEHMLDPWRFVRQAQRILKPGGLLVASIPNVRHVSVLGPLVASGRWRYGDSGILDRTHLRFFTRETALELMSCERLRVVRWIRRANAPGSKSALLDRLTLGLMRDFTAPQYLIASQKVEPAVASGRAEP